MRYATGGGLTAKERVKRERLRLEAAKRFEQGDAPKDIAADLRVTRRAVEGWRKVWRERGIEGLASRGPASLPRLSAVQFARLERELDRGPLVHGFADQRWTLARIKTLIGRMFHVSCTVQGVRKLLVRNGWSCQVPARRAIERDDAAVETWVKETWPRVEAPRRRSADGSASRMRRAGR